MIRIYLEIPQRIKVFQKKVVLGQIAKVVLKEKDMLSKVLNMEVLDLKEEKFKVMDIMEIVEKIHSNFGEADVVNFGETEFIVQLDEQGKTNKILEYGKVAFVSLIIFFGSAFSIMTFNEDASVADIFERIYQICRAAGFARNKLAEIAYSVGLSIGILLFYNHIFRKPKLEDPTPMQIEMREFEKDINETIIINSDKEEE